jgi:hypothetical protein
MSKPLIAHTGVNGQPVETAAHLLAFRDWVVEFCADHPDVRFINATGAGLLHGLECRPVDGAVAAAPETPPVFAVREATRRPRRDFVQAAIEAFDQEQPAPWTTWSAVGGASVEDLVSLFASSLDARQQQAIRAAYEGWRRRADGSGSAVSG